MSEQTPSPHPRSSPRGWRNQGKLMLFAGLVIVVVAAGIAALALLAPSLLQTNGSSSSTSSTTMPTTAMFGVNAQHTGVVPGEQSLTYANVSHLVADWSSLPTGGSIFSSPVVAGGVVYVGSFDGRLYAFRAGAGVSDTCGWYDRLPRQGERQ